MAQHRPPSSALNCEQKGSKCKLVKETEDGVQQTNKRRYRFYCRQCGHLGASAFEFCDVCQDWMNVNKIPHHLKSRIHKENLRLRGDEQPMPPAWPPRKVEEELKEEEEPSPTGVVDFAPAGDMDYDLDSLVFAVMNDGRRPTDSLVYDDAVMNDNFFELAADSVGFLAPIIPPEAEEEDDHVQVVEAELEPERVWWKDFGVRLRMVLSRPPQQDFRPQYDYLKIHVLSPAEQQAKTGIPAFRYADLALQEDYHVNLRRVEEARAGRSAHLTFNSFSPREDIFGDLAELPVDEVHGTATVKFHDDDDRASNLECPIVFYRCLESDDYDNQMALINRLVKDISFAQGSAEQPFGGGPSGGPSSSTRKRSRRYDHPGPENVAFRAADRALVVIVRNFRKLDPPPRMMRELEPVALQCGLRYLLHDLVSIRLGPIVRSVFERAPAMTKVAGAAFDSRPVAETVLEFFGCAFAVEAVWAKEKLMSFIVRSIAEHKVAELKKRVAERQQFLSRGLVPLRRMISVTDSLSRGGADDNSARPFYGRARTISNVLSSQLSSLSREESDDDDLAGGDGGGGEPRGGEPIDVDESSEDELSLSRTEGRVRKKIRDHRKSAPPASLAALQSQVLGAGFDDGVSPASEAPPPPKRREGVLLLTRADTHVGPMTDRERVQLLADKDDARYGPEQERTAKSWMERVLGRKFTHFADELADGAVLCELANAVQVGSVEQIVPEDAETNLTNFLEACFKLGVPDDFTVEELQTDFTEVTRCVVALSERAAYVHRAFFPKPEVRNRTSRLTVNVVRKKHVSSDQDDVVLVDQNDDQDDVETLDGRDSAAAPLTPPSLPPPEQHQTHLHHEEERPPSHHHGKSIFSRMHDALFGSSSPKTPPQHQKTLGGSPQLAHHDHVYKLDGPDVLVKPSGDAQIVVWSSTRRSETTKRSEHELCRLLHDKKKKFEVVYLDIAPDREDTFRAISQFEDSSRAPLPVLTVGPRYLGGLDNVTALEFGGLFDAEIQAEQPGAGFWVWTTPHEWNVSQLGVPTPEQTQHKAVSFLANDDEQHHATP